MTIYEIKERTLGTSPHFFSKETLKFFGQTMSSFRIKKQKDGRYRITAPSYWHGERMPDTVRYFNPENNKLENE